MSHALNSVNSVKCNSNANIDIGLSTLISSPNASEVLGIDASGNAKALTGATKVGDLGVSYVVQSSGWGGSPAITEGYALLIRGGSSQIYRDTSLVTIHTIGSPQWLQGWTVAAGDYLFILNQAIDTGPGGDCNAQLYNVTTSAYVGPKVRFETGNFSRTLTYYASVTSSTKYEFRVRDLNGTVSFLNSTSMFSCTIQVFKL